MEGFEVKGDNCEDPLGSILKCNTPDPLGSAVKYNVRTKLGDAVVRVSEERALDANIGDPVVVAWRTEDAVMLADDGS